MHKKTVITTILALAVAFAVAGGAFAAKASSSLSLVLVGSGSAPAASVQPSYGSTISFVVQTNQTDHPNVNVRCYQGTAFVYDGWISLWPGSVTGQNLVLSSGYWTSGAADCTANLVAFNSKGQAQTLASMTFHVNA
jgi:hypothetical protein